MVPPDGVGLEPRFRGRWIDAAETVRERRSSSFYFPKYTFDGVSEAVVFDAVAVAFAAKSTDRIGGVIDEKHGVEDAVFLSYFSKKLSCDRNRIRRE